jgi:hypothetical protein
MVQFLADSAVASAGAYGSIFQNYLTVLNDGLKGADDAFLLHDELEEINEPIYFKDFVAHAERHGLRYLVEAELREVLPHVFKPEVREQLQRFAGDSIALEQYMDFLRNRMFRQTLLCHADAPVQQMLRPEPVYGCLARSHAQPVNGDDESNRPGLMQFRSRDNATLTTDHPISTAAMTALGECWPRALPFGELLAAARGAASPAPSASSQTPDEVVLAGNLLRAFGYSNQLVDLHSFSPDFTMQLSARPVASPVARLEAMGRNVVTNLWHERVNLQPFQCHLLVRLDGSRKWGDLVRELRPVAAQLGAPGKAREPFDQAALERHLQALAGAALLVG